MGNHVHPDDLSFVPTHTATSCACELVDFHTLDRCPLVIVSDGNLLLLTFLEK